MKVLVFLDYFTPAFRAGGPIRIFESLARAAKLDRQVAIATQDRDWGEAKKLGVEEGKWLPFENGEVIYLSREHRRYADLRALLDRSAADSIHLNSLFSRVWTMKLLLLRRRGLVRQRVFLSPHGELADSALAIKRGRKTAFLWLAKALGLFRDLTWIATSEKEIEEIKSRIGAGAQVVLAPPPLPAPIAHAAAEKQRGRLRLVFLARIGAMKNISFLLRVLPHVRGEIQFDLYGPVDPEYDSDWRRIFDSLRALSPNFSCVYKGAVKSSDAMNFLSQYDLFVQPSLSENFGFSIVEALAAGTPVLISDRTPWNEVNEMQIGRALSLDEPTEWVRALQEFIDMENDDWQMWSERAQKWVRSKSATGEKLLEIYADSNENADTAMRDASSRSSESAR